MAQAPEEPRDGEQGQQPITVTVNITPSEEAYTPPAVAPDARATRSKPRCGCACGSEAGSGGGTMG